jgi:hypothetical protein
VAFIFRIQSALNFITWNCTCRNGHYGNKVLTRFHNWIGNLRNHLSPLFERTELLLPWKSPGVNASFPTRMTSAQAFTDHCQPYYNVGNHERSVGCNSIGCHAAQGFRRCGRPNLRDETSYYFIVTIFFERHVHEASHLAPRYNNKADRDQHDGRQSVCLPSQRDNIPAPRLRSNYWNYSLAELSSFVRECPGYRQWCRVGLLLFPWDKVRPVCWLLTESSGGWIRND